MIDLARRLHPGANTEYRTTDLRDVTGPPLKRVRGSCSRVLLFGIPGSGSERVISSYRLCSGIRVFARAPRPADRCGAEREDDDDAGDLQRPSCEHRRLIGTTLGVAALAAWDDEEQRY